MATEDVCDSRSPKPNLENPRDKWCLTVCFVCKDVAKPGQEHLRNYGGIVCYSCRAFWRRSHQNTRRPNFVCKKNAKCIITVATRRRCQKCRYERCLVAGMNPDAVLNEDQKKVRFRKLLMKRQKLLAKQMKAKQAAGLSASRKVKNVVKDTDSDDTESSLSDMSVDGFHHHSMNFNEIHHQGPLQQMVSGQSDFFLHNPVGLQYQQKSNFDPSFEFCRQHQYPNQGYGQHEIEVYYQRLFTFQPRSLDPGSPLEVEAQSDCLLDLTTKHDTGIETLNLDNSSVKSKIGQIVDAYVGAMESQRCLKIDLLLASISGLHSDCESQSIISKSDLKFLTLRLSQTFVQFAMSLGEFRSLDVVNQEKLLVQNTSLFVQLFLGQNFLVESGHIPKDIKFEEQPKKKVWMSNFSQNLFLERFNSMTGLFAAGTDLDAYGRLILKLKGLHEASSCEQKAILAYILLFYPNNTTNCLKELEEMFSSAIRISDDSLTLSNLIATLTSMVNFCTDNIIWNEMDFYYTKQVRNSLSKDELFATC